MSDVKRIPIVAIDGPGGSGKGTIGRRVARQLGWKFLDSGALYRLVGICAIQRGIALDDAPQLAALAERLNEIGDGWRELALKAVRMIKGRDEVDYPQLGTLLLALAERETDFFRDLKRAVN